MSFKNFWENFAKQKLLFISLKISISWGCHNLEWSECIEWTLFSHSTIILFSSKGLKTKKRSTWVLRIKRIINLAIILIYHKWTETAGKHSKIKTELTNQQMISFLRGLEYFALCWVFNFVKIYCSVHLRKNCFFPIPSSPARVVTL